MNRWIRAERPMNSPAAAGSGGTTGLSAAAQGAEMSITVRELLQLPHLRLTLTAGEAGLDRRVSWVHSSDLPDPWQWLGPAELLLTNGTNLSADKSAQVRFID